MGCEHPDWLPAGWRVTVKARRSSGKKDKYYINPSNGLKFKSKPEVLRFLKCSGRDRKAKNLVKTVTGNLPPGWIKEVRTKRRHGRTRRDPTYIDPVSGRHFRSMQEVLRYLESKEIRNTKPKTEATKPRHNLTIDKTADRNMIRHDSVKSELKLKPRPARRMKVAAAMAQDVKQRGEEVCLAIEFSDKLRKVKQRLDRLKDVRKVARNKAAAKSTSKDQTLANSGAVNDKVQWTSKKTPDIQLEDNAATNHSGPEGLKRKRVNNLPCRTSPRLARAAVIPSMEAKTSVKVGDEGETDISDTKNISKGKARPLEEVEIDVEGKSGVSKRPKEPPLKCRVENPANNQLEKIVPPEEQKSLGSTIENLLMDPCIEFAIKTLTGAIPIEEASKVCISNSSASSTIPGSTSTMTSSVDIWAVDPRVEFSVRRLTNKPSGKLQITFEQPFGSSYDTPTPTLPKIRSDNFYTMRQSSCNVFDDGKQLRVRQ
ncbi:methyl-CpG-binding domain-containing protein 13-like isoform X2 [Andrographis paniculata]|uniref:methyl-CpG-binding domain-containing protein 13-like isoform X2 n=1 Tax=Andrographis paniculata TaxID=175694 RepID=UPI0021E8FFF2|nr:methyl-CpG-binding domain-containing protein 13-like isoform X2 [Andrographis paniculata]